MASSRDTSTVQAINKSIEYQRELAKLIEKSRGTKYEVTLQRIMESKIKEQQLLEEMQSKPETTYVYERLDISRLEASSRESSKAQQELSLYPDRFVRKFQSSFSILFLLVDMPSKLLINISTHQLNHLHKFTQS